MVPARGGGGTMRLKDKKRGTRGSSSGSGGTILLKDRARGGILATRAASIRTPLDLTAFVNQPGVYIAGVLQGPVVPAPQFDTAGFKDKVSAMLQEPEPQPATQKQVLTEVLKWSMFSGEPIDIGELMTEVAGDRTEKLEQMMEGLQVCPGPSVQQLVVTEKMPKKSKLHQTKTDTSGQVPPPSLLL